MMLDISSVWITADLLYENQSRPTKARGKFSEVQFLCGQGTSSYESGLVGPPLSHTMLYLWTASRRYKWSPEIRLAPVRFLHFSSQLVGPTLPSYSNTNRDVVQIKCISHGPCSYSFRFALWWSLGHYSLMNLEKNSARSPMQMPI
ncbi:hypothetical protein OG21DRAFT_1216467 [Imleria badia]|nr:hypothetical protein OG21DRAFT_1216467 [Imleria badia]